MVTLEALEQMLYRYADELMNIAHEQQTVDRATRAKLFAWRRGLSGKGPSVGLRIRMTYFGSGSVLS